MASLEFKMNLILLQTQNKVFEDLVSLSELLNHAASSCLSICCVLLTTATLNSRQPPTQIDGAFCHSPEKFKFPEYVNDSTKRQIYPALTYTRRR